MCYNEKIEVKMNILKVLGIDLDYTILSCKSLLYKLMNRIQRIKGDERISYTEIDPARVKQSPSLLAKISKIFNPNAYHPIPDAIETINHLHKMGYEIQFISNRPNFAPLVSMTTSWLEDHDVEYDKLVLGCKNKAAYAEVCHLDMMIDDNIHTCKNLAKKGIPSILFKSELSDDDYNAYQENILSPHITLLTSWKAIKNKIMKLLEDGDEFSNDLHPKLTH